VVHLGAIVLPSISSWDLLGFELHFLEVVGSHQAEPALIVYATPGQAVSIGRYHLYSGAAEHDGIIATRRLTGGRAVAGGKGWINLALVVPQRGSLLPQRDTNLKPDQVMNRYARGLLAALRSLGLECFYPGRDAITVGGREIAMCTFETDASGALLFEASIAVTHGMEELPHYLDRLDRGGTVPSVVHGPATSTTLARELGRDIGFIEVASAILKGHAEAFGGAKERELTGAESVYAVQRGKELQSIHWLRRVADKSEYNRSGRSVAQLGQIETWLGVSTENRIDRSMLSGDFIANSPGVAELEAALEGQPHDLVTISSAATRVFSGGRNYILGLGDLSNLVRLIASAR